MVFHYFDKFLSEYERRFEREYGYFRPIIEEKHFAPSKGKAEMIRKVYETDPLLCPRCGGEMRIIAFIEDHKVIDRIIRHLKLTFETERPPPPQILQQELLMAAEERREYF
ncbi:hypothetical protein ES703_47142 [subsurface metagenome]